MPNKIVEDKMTKLVGLLGDMAEKGCVDELAYLAFSPFQ